MSAVLIVSTLEHSAGAWVRASVGGRVADEASRSILRAALSSLCRHRPRGMSLDVAELEAVDEPGLGVLEDVVRLAGEVGSWFEIVNARLPLHRALSERPLLADVTATYAWRRPPAPRRPPGG